MGRLLRVLVGLGALAGVAIVTRRLLAERAPNHGLNGSGPRLGSFDTWPPVPKKAAAD
jgi:hypothetical protein